MYNMHEDVSTNLSKLPLGVHHQECGGEEDVTELVDSITELPSSG